MPKYLDQNGLATLKSKLDENYAKKNDVCDIGYPTYSTALTYALGDVVIYNNKIYQCISAISTAEAWTSAHWQQVAVDVNNVVTITATGVQSDAMAAKIRNAKAVYYNGALYTKRLEDSGEVDFAWQEQTSGKDTQHYLYFFKSNKEVVTGTADYNRIYAIGGKSGTVSIDSSLQATGTSTAGTLGLTGKLPYLTTAPSADNTSGFITIVVLSAEPAQRYNGFLYLILSSN